MIYDCFQFYNEIDILKIRLNVLKDVVDKVVLSESTTTFSGKEKPLYFEENKELFKEFEDKIIHIIVDDTPMDCDAFTRDSHQKCAVMRGLRDAKEDDIIIFSDVDEIPNPDTLKKLLCSDADYYGEGQAENIECGIEHGKIYALAQRNFYCYLNLEEKTGSLLSVTGEFPEIEGEDRKWLGTKICRYSLLKEYTTEQLRDKEQQNIMVRVPDGGWHFSYMGGHNIMDVKDRVRDKVISAAHQEYNSKKVINEAIDKLHAGFDMFDREARFSIVPIDSNYPTYIKENAEEYTHLIKNIDNMVVKLCRKFRVIYRKNMHKIKQLVWNILHGEKN